MENKSTGWRPDILGDGYEMQYITQADDYSGKVRCTVVRHKASKSSDKAVLYIHGYSDYFLQYEMGTSFASKGYNFYAVDLRKYGRSLLPGQKKFEVRDLHEYFSDIDAALKVMAADGNKKAVLIGHSTGGLTASLYLMENHPFLIKGLILNSPFLDWNLPKVLKRLAVPVLSALGRRFPSIKIHQKADRGYAESLSADLGGEWHYRRDWKPDVMPDPDAGWLRAINSAHHLLKPGKIEVPILLMRSAKSAKYGDGKEEYSSSDAILNVHDISRVGKMLGNDVKEEVFEGGLHDLVLSSPAVRERVYSCMLDWLSKVL